MHTVSLLLFPDHYRASLCVSYDGTAVAVVDGNSYDCCDGRVDWKQVYREFVSDARTDDTALGSAETDAYLYWAIVLSVTDDRVTVEMRVNERIPRKRALVLMEPNDSGLDFTPLCQMKKYIEVFTSAAVTQEKKQICGEIYATAGHIPTAIAAQCAATANE